MAAGQESPPCVKVTAVPSQGDGYSKLDTSTSSLKRDLLAETDTIHPKYSERMRSSKSTRSPLEK